MHAASSLDAPYAGSAAAMSASDVQPMAVDVPAALTLRPDQLASALPSHHLLPLR